MREPATAVNGQQKSRAGSNLAKQPDRKKQGSANNPGQNHIEMWENLAHSSLK